MRHTHAVMGRDGAEATILLMPAWVEAGFLGVKTVMVNPTNSAGGLPGVHSTYMLYDASTGVPLALMDGNEITSRRTAAASALAASLIVADAPRNQLVVGAGRVGRLVPEAYRAVFEIASVAIWDRHEDQAHSAVEELRGKGIHARVSTDLAADARNADVITCATLAREPIIRGEWLRAGCHLDLIGSFTPEMREADDQCFVRAAIYMDTDEALKKSGELLGPVSRSVFTPSDVKARLADLCRDPRRGRNASGTRTVFKSVGTALEDLAAAGLVMKHAS